jgi:L-asparaginase II
LIEANPILIEVRRGERVESRHRGAAVVVDAIGRIVGAWGDIEGSIFPRSAIKPLQALAWVETGGADRFGLSECELAIACGSHQGEPLHVACVEAWLARIGCREADLVCGPHAPIAEAAANAILRAGAVPSRLHNNCSGKHTGFLAACRGHGLTDMGYEDIDHPLQVAVRRVLSEMGATTVAADEAAIDGCGVPVYPLPLTALATAFARLAAPDKLDPHRAEAVRRIIGAMVAEPLYVSGSGGFDSRIIAAGAGRVVSKTGAEGVHVAALPVVGLGIAVKIDDGAQRAANAAIAALIRRFDGAATVADTAVRNPIRNTLGEVVGEIGPAVGWPGV